MPDLTAKLREVLLEMGPRWACPACGEAISQTLRWENRVTGERGEYDPISSPASCNACGHRCWRTRDGFREMTREEKKLWPLNPRAAGLKKMQEYIERRICPND